MTAPRRDLSDAVPDRPRRETQIEASRHRSDGNRRGNLELGDETAALRITVNGYVIDGRVPARRTVCGAVPLPLESSVYPVPGPVR
jgi:hypothetical protein